MTLTVREIELTSSGTAEAGTIGVPPSRYAGCYYSFTGTASRHVDIENLGRSVFSKAGANNGDGLQELAPTAEKIVNGHLVVSMDGVAPGDTGKFTVYLHV